jgi:aldose 1-epimerase
MNRFISRRQALAGLGATLATSIAGCSSYQTEILTKPDGSHTSTARDAKSGMKIEKSSFGKLADGSPVSLYTLTSDSGTILKFTDYGLIITELWVKDRHGKLGNVVLGADSLDRYLKGFPFTGAAIGRFANRIARGRFTLDGKQYQLAINNGPNHLHGGLAGFDKKVWKVVSEEITASKAGIRFGYTSRDGDENYPGNLKVEVSYYLFANEEVQIHYHATSDKPTPINLTNHSYFNLAGRGDIKEHELQLWADHYTPVDAELIPTGTIASVKGTPLDFTTPHLIGERLDKTGLTPPGYDHNYVLNHPGREVALAARAYHAESGRVMEVLTDQPGVQLYTSNFAPVEGVECVGGIRFGRHGAFCLETQNFPDAVNRPNFPSAILSPGATYDRTTTLRFSRR